VFELKRLAGGVAAISTTFTVARGPEVPRAQPERGVIVDARAHRHASLVKAAALAVARRQSDAQRVLHLAVIDQTLPRRATA
jgi:hypothetical protein